MNIPGSLGSREISKPCVADDIMTPLQTVAVQSTGQISFDVHFPLEGLVGTAGPSDRMLLGCFFPRLLGRT